MVSSPSALTRTSPAAVSAVRVEKVAVVLLPGCRVISGFCPNGVVIEAVTGSSERFATVTASVAVPATQRAVALAEIAGPSPMSTGSDCEGSTSSSR